MKTISRSEKGDGQVDLDGSIVDGVESLRQRIVSALKMTKGEWLFDRSAGMDWGLIFSHQQDQALAASIITHEVKKEAGNELIHVKSVDWSLDAETRTLHYRLEIETIYGDLTISGGSGNGN